MFCNLLQDDKKQRILFQVCFFSNYQQNERFYIIEDIRPCAKHHYLVISKKHIRDCNALTHDDIGLCIADISC